MIDLSLAVTDLLHFPVSSFHYLWLVWLSESQKLRIRLSQSVSTIIHDHSIKMTEQDRVNSGKSLAWLTQHSQSHSRWWWVTHWVDITQSNQYSHFLPLRYVIGFCQSKTGVSSSGFWKRLGGDCWFEWTKTQTRRGSFHILYSHQKFKKGGLYHKYVERWVNFAKIVQTTSFSV